MEEALSKIRPHTSSSLGHQKTPAQLLIALESTFKDQSTEGTPTAYFAALLTSLDGTIQKKDISLDDAAILPAVLYLLALVAPFVPEPVIRSNLNTLLSLTAPLFPALNQHPPPLRSQLTLYHSIFKSLERSQLEVQGVRQTFASIVQLCGDPRPKVRKKAVEVVQDVLENPPTPLLLHPYSERVADWAKNTLVDANATPFGKGKGGKQAPGAEIAIHVVAFLESVVPSLPGRSLPAITDIVLSLPRLGNTYLTQSCYSFLSQIFISSIDDSSNFAEQLTHVLKVVLSSPPSKTDAQLSQSWLQILGVALVSFNLANSKGASSEIPKAWKAAWNFLDSKDAVIRLSAAQALSNISSCLSPALISAAVADKTESSTIRKIIAQVWKAIDSLHYSHSIPDVLSVVSSLIENLHHRESPKAPTAAEQLLMPLIERIADLRISKGFEYKEYADATLSSAMRILGPEVLLKALPLNLEPSSRSPGAEPRAFLLPLLSQPHASPLSHFVSYFVPLSERMFDLQQKAEIEGRQSEAKVWSVLVGQVWAGLPGYCSGSPDIKEALTPAFAQLLSQLLYSQVELRQSILKALGTLVESNLSLVMHSDEEDSASDMDEDEGEGPPSFSTLTPEEAQDNIVFLRTQFESWSAVLFNVYGSVGRESRGIVGDVIDSWLSIAEDEEIHRAFLKVKQLFKTNLPLAQKNPNVNNDIGNMATTALDILVLLLPNLSDDDLKALYTLSLSSEVLSCKDNGVQKRGYKILAKVVEIGNVEVDVEETLRKLDEMIEGLNAAAKKDRFNLLEALVTLLPPTSMHIIPSLIPEAVLGTKEPSEKARTAAFDLVVAMGMKMSEGGIVKRSMLDGMDVEDGAEDAVANVEEFLTMIAGGLAGASPHMISATVTAISRLVFEFKNSISPKMHDEILSTMLVFLSSTNREIVKSILGFVKLAIHTLPVEVLRPHLKDLVPGLLNWSHDHKNHFKVKVRHIFERILRRFSFEEVYACAGEEEAAKVLVNIKKRKDRAKRKKANKVEEDEDSPPAKAAAGDAFEDVLYGSESEIEDSDEEDLPAAATSGKKKKTIAEGSRLRLDDDEPMDLLRGAATNITNAKPHRRKKPGQEASRFKTDEETGRMVIDEDGDDDGDGAAAAAEDVAGSAYREAITSVDGITRGPTGRIKFNKDTKKRRREEEAMDVDIVDGDEMSPTKAKRSKRKADSKFGQEFKAKKAGGDVKKGGVDPYAYMPLSQAAKSGRGGQKIGIAGKR